MMQSNLQSAAPASLHVAIVMDGNGRWAAARGLPRLAGHRSGVRAARRVVEAAPALGVGTLTLFAFSSDNWKRPGRDETSPPARPASSTSGPGTDRVTSSPKCGGRAHAAAGGRHSLVERRASEQPVSCEGHGLAASSACRASCTRPYSVCRASTRDPACGSAPMGSI